MMRAIVLGLRRGLEMLLWTGAFLLFVAGYRTWVVSDPPSLDVPRQGVLYVIVWLFQPVVTPAGWSYMMAALGVTHTGRFVPPRQRNMIILVALAVSVAVSFLARPLLGKDATTWSISLIGAATFWVLASLILPFAEDPDEKALRVLTGQEQEDYESMKALAERLRRR